MSEPQQDPGMREGLSRRGLLRAAAIGGLGVGAAELLSVSGALAAGGSGKNPYPPTPNFKFAFINPNTTDVFFQPSQYGAQDACSLLGCSFQWTGSQTESVADMVSAMQSAISAGVDGLVVNMVNANAFTKLTAVALSKGIPVVSFNSDAPASGRLAYIGQDRFTTGYQIGQKIVELVPSGKVALFIASPGALSNQPVLDGMKSAIKASGKPVELTTTALTSDPNIQVTRVDSYYQGNKDIKGMFATGSGETQAVGKIMQKYGLHAKGVKAGGMDLLATTVQFLSKGVLDFAIDEEPYYQGFLPILYLYMYKLSGSVLGPVASNTGVKAATPQNVAPYLQASRYTGTSSKEMYIKS